MLLLFCQFQLQLHESHFTYESINVQLSKQKKNINFQSNYNNIITTDGRPKNFA